MRNAWATLACAVFMSVSSRAADNPLLHNVDRRIDKEPQYIAKRPLYGLLVFGPTPQKRIWMVLDHSKPTAELYDLIYVDLNADGDLTDPTERAVGQAEGDSVRFQLPDLKDPVTGAVHTHFTTRVTGASTPTVMLSLLWKAHFKMGGGYPEDPEDKYLEFSDSPGTAPVMWAYGNGPFRFQRWYSGKLSIDGADDFKVFVGQQGAGRNSFWAFQEHFLPEAEGVKASLIYRDAADKERQVICLLKERC